MGNEPALQGLLRVYKDYYPDIILGSTSTSRKSFAPVSSFTLVRPQMQRYGSFATPQHLCRTTQHPADFYSNRTLSGEQGSRESKMRALQLMMPSPISIMDSKCYERAPNKAKDRPSPKFIHTKVPRYGQPNTCLQTFTKFLQQASVTLEGIDSVDDFVEKLDRIEPPGQLISLLTDPLLQKYFSLKPTPIIARRIELWLATCLEGQYEGERLGNGDPEYLSEVLNGLLKHTQYTKVHKVNA